MSKKQKRRRTKRARLPETEPALVAQPQSDQRIESTARRPRAFERALLAIVLLWTFLLGCTPMKDTDIWWHLRTAQLIVERGELPQVDWFTFTDATQPWIDLHWGFQLLMLGLYRLGGVDALVLFKAATLTIVVALGWMASGNGLPACAKAGLWLLPIICLSGRALERPEMLSLMFLGLWLWIVPHLDTRPRLIWLLPAIQVAWINFHALFVLGLIVGAAYAADRMIREFAGGRWGLARAPEHPSPITLFYAGLLALLASLANPYFEEGALFPLELYRKFSVDQELYSVIGEFQRPIDFVTRHGLGNLYLVSELGLWLMTAASFTWLGFQKRWSLLRLLLFAGFSNLAWEASRNTGIFALVSGVVLCWNFADALALRAARPGESRRSRQRAGRSELPRAAGKAPPRKVGHGIGTLIAGFLHVGLIVSVLTGAWTILGQEGKRFGLGEANAWYIHDAAKFAGRSGFPDRAFVANSGQAAVYLFHNGPLRRVFMDARLEVVTKQTFARFGQIRSMMARSDPRFMEALKGADGSLPVFIFDSRYSRAEIQGLLRMPEFRLVFADGAAAVFLDEPTTTRLKLPLADPIPLHRPPAP